MKYHLEITESGIRIQSYTGDQLTDCSIECPMCYGQKQKWHSDKKTMIDCATCFGQGSYSEFKFRDGLQVGFLYFAPNTPPFPLRIYSVYGNLHSDTIIAQIEEYRLFHLLIQHSNGVPWLNILQTFGEDLQTISLYGLLCDTIVTSVDYAYELKV